MAKPGDLVLCVSSDGCFLQENRIYVVLPYDNPPYIKVLPGSQHGGWFPSRFIKVELTAIEKLIYNVD